MACLREIQKVVWKARGTIKLESDVLLPSLCRTDDSDAVIMQPGVLCIMVRLLPRLYHEDHPQVLVDEHTGLSFSHD